MGLVATLPGDSPYSGRINAAPPERSVFTTPRLRYGEPAEHRHRGRDQADRSRREHWKQITRGEREIMRIISEIISDGVRSGAFKDVPPTVVTFAIIGMAAWVYRWYRPAGPLTLDQIGEVLGEVVVRGVISAAGGGRLTANSAELV